MAAYNGAKYIEEQIHSILPQLTRDDELVIVDDSSTDNTYEVVSALNDSRIRLSRNQSNIGYVGTFERAIGLSRGEFIFLSDQDDIWLGGRVEAMILTLEKNLVVASNFRYFGGKPRKIESLRLRTSDSRRTWRNIFALWIGIRPYYGCAMAFRRAAKDIILPFPTFMRETHDQWIALIGNLSGSIFHLETDTLTRRLHEENATPKKLRSARQIIAARISFVCEFTLARSRLSSLR
jgi:glycosyltransferase involved in cell wall biosynthesis